MQDGHANRLVETSLKAGVWYKSDIDLATGLCDCVYGYVPSAADAQNLLNGLSNQGFHVSTDVNRGGFYDITTKAFKPLRGGGNFVELYYVRIEKPGGGNGGKVKVNLAEWPFTIQDLKMFNRNPLPAPGHTGPYPQEINQFYAALHELAVWKQHQEQYGGRKPN